MGVKMRGIAGTFGALRDGVAADATAMVKMLSHRGPGSAVQKFPASGRNGMGAIQNTLLLAARRVDRFASKGQTLGALLNGSRSIEELHETMAYKWKEPGSPVVGTTKSTAMVPSFVQLSSQIATLKEP
jgi:hypothetical protein